MIKLGSELINFVPIFSWVLLTVRFAGVLISLPGIGTERVPHVMHFYLGAMLAAALSLSGVSAPEPANLAELILMVASEFALGFAMGMIPSFILSSVAVAGQVASGAIGLGQANMIDRSLGGSVSLLSQLQVLLATAIFLLLDGHHAVLQVAAGSLGETAIGMFRPGGDVAQLLTERLVSSFELAVIVCAPVLVTSLITQFILGLVTKFVPQVNIFIISLPLGIMIGLYVIDATLPGLVGHVMDEFSYTEEHVSQIFPQLVE